MYGVGAEGGGLALSFYLFGTMSKIKKHSSVRRLASELSTVVSTAYPWDGCQVGTCRALLSFIPSTVLPGPCQNDCASDGGRAGNTGNFSAPHALPTPGFPSTCTCHFHTITSDKGLWLRWRILWLGTPGPDAKKCSTFNTCSSTTNTIR